jgi:hypothetical protein
VTQGRQIHARGKKDYQFFVSTSFFLVVEIEMTELRGDGTIKGESSSG